MTSDLITADPPRHLLPRRSILAIGLGLVAAAAAPATAFAAPETPDALYCDDHLFPAPDLFVKD